MNLFVFWLTWYSRGDTLDLGIRSQNTTHFDSGFDSDLNQI